MHLIGRLEDALSILNKAIDIEPTEAATYIHKGYVIYYFSISFMSLKAIR